MSKTKRLRGPLLCWDIYSIHLVEQAIHFNKQTEIAILKTYKKKFGWTLNIEKELTEKDFEAIVLTDFNQEIQWVNKGFTKMTGYPANYTKGKTPNFLQGEASSINSKKSFSENLLKGDSFKEEIINYRKNGKPYTCKIELYPLRDTNNAIVHFLALEKEV